MSHLSPIDPSRLFIAALEALGTDRSPRSSKEARRIAHAELFATFRDEGDARLPSVDASEVRDLEWALHEPIARAQHASDLFAVRVDWSGLTRLVGAEEARLALFCHGIYPVTCDGQTIWGCERAHTGEPAAWVSFRQLRWACRQFLSREATHLSINVRLGPASPA